MAITTTLNLTKYLQTHSIPFETITPVTGGSTNFVWRLTSPSDQRSTTTTSSSIIKHAEPFLAGPFLAKKPHVDFPLDRMGFEVRALGMLPSLFLSFDRKGKGDEKEESDGGDRIEIAFPKIIHHDEDNHILQLEDVGSRTLHESYTDPTLDISSIGKSIGRWLAILHQSTTSDLIKDQFNHVVAKRMYRWNYNGLADVLERYGFDPELGRRINERFGALIESDDICVCHTDLWPGNILISHQQQHGSQDDLSKLGVVEWPSRNSKVQLAVIDWEVTRNGDGMTDVGHFAGEAFFLDRLRGGRGLLNSFLKGYLKQKGKLSERERGRVAAEFGTRITFWPSIYKWISEDEKTDIVTYGQAILEKVDAEDWIWFESSDLGVLFRVANETHVD